MTPDSTQHYPGIKTKSKKPEGFGFFTPLSQNKIFFFLLLRLRLVGDEHFLTTAIKAVSIHG